MTYECNDCHGTFDGIGRSDQSGYSGYVCPQCALIFQQKKQYEEQRRINEERRWEQEMYSRRSDPDDISWLDNIKNYRPRW